MNETSDKKPHIFAIAAISADGYIARFEKDVSLDWTSEEDTKRFVNLTKKAGAVVMGRKTFWATPRPGWPLPKRMNYVLTRDLEKVWDFYKDDEEWEKIEAKENLAFVNLSPEKLILLVEEDGYDGLAVCGGTSIYTAWLPHIQTLYLTRETKVDLKEGKTLFEGLDLKGLNAMLEKDFELVSSEKANDRGTIFEEWKRKS